MGVMIFPQCASCWFEVYKDLPLLKPFLCFHDNEPLAEDHCSFETTFAGLFRSVLSLDRLGCRGHMRDDSGEILFQSFLQEAFVSRSGMADASTL